MLTTRNQTLSGPVTYFKGQLLSKRFLSHEQSAFLTLRQPVAGARVNPEQVVGSERLRYTLSLAESGKGD